MLGAAEAMLTTGEPLTPFTPAQTALLRDDPAVRQVSATMGAKGKAALIAAVPVLQQAQQHTIGERHMLKLFEANDHQMLGQLDLARPLFVSVLTTHPWLAGAYKDLGDLHFRQFDMGRAWRCWDAGRRLAPALGIFSSVDRFEETLLKQHPEYF